MENEDEYDFDNWHQNVPVDEDELKRKLKKKRKAEHKKIREEAKKKREEEERKKEKGSDNESSDEEEIDEEQAKKERMKEKREKRKEKKKEKKEKKRKRDEAKITGESVESEDEEGNKKQKKEVISGNGKRGEFGIWVGNLAFSTTEDMLKKFFANCGTITRINLPINKKTKNNKGFAYIDFEDEQSMKNAVALSEQTLENRNLLIKSSKDFRGRPAKTSSAANSSNTNNTNNNTGSAPAKTGGKPNNKKESPTLFIGNLPYAATADGISKCFKEFGEISNVRVATFEDNQEKCKGFAYVDFANIDSAIKAMNSGKKPKLLGRVLRVEYAGEDATRRGYNRLHKKSKDNHAKDNNKESKPAEPKPIAIAKWDGELVTFKGQKTVFNDDDDE